MGAAVFFQCDSRPLFDTFCLENLSVFSIHQKMEQNPTYNWADLIHFRDDSIPSPVFGALSVRDMPKCTRGSVLCSPGQLV